MEIASAAARIETAMTLEAPRPERAELRRVFADSADALYRFILVRVGGRRDVADDLLQQTCCEAARHRGPPIDQDGGEAWLRGIARNLIRRHWRKAKRHAGLVPLENASAAGQLVEDLESRPLPPDALIQEESIARLLRAITSLSAADQKLIFAYYFDGRPQAAIARDLEVTEKSIESRLFRVRGRLRAALRNAERSGGP